MTKTTIDPATIDPGRRDHLVHCGHAAIEQLKLDDHSNAPADVRQAIAELQADARVAHSGWRRCGETKPPKHANYKVIRNGLLFTATPCYGMHAPWWVVRLMPDRWPNEADPVPMEDDDLWQAYPTKNDS